MPFSSLDSWVGTWHHPVSHQKWGGGDSGVKGQHFGPVTLTRNLKIEHDLGGWDGQENTRNRVQAGNKKMKNRLETPVIFRIFREKCAEGSRSKNNKGFPPCSSLQR